MRKIGLHVLEFIILCSDLLINKFKTGGTGTLMMTWGKSPSISLTKGKGGSITCTFAASFNTYCRNVLVTPTADSLFGWTYVCSKSVSRAICETYITADASGTKTSGLYFMAIGY